MLRRFTGRSRSCIPSQAFPTANRWRYRSVWRTSVALSPARCGWVVIFAKGPLFGAYARAAPQSGLKGYCTRLRLRYVLPLYTITGFMETKETGLTENPSPKTLRSEIRYSMSP